VSKFYDNIELLQRFAGVTVDRRFGEETAEALVRKLGLAPRKASESLRAPSEFLVCLDAGHGQDNRKPGVFDPGCERKGRQEAMLAWEWAVELCTQLTALKVPVTYTRKAYPESCPLGFRAKFAKQQGATHFVSIHVNDSMPSGSGTETLIESKFSKPFATLIQRALVDNLGLRDRGVKHRDDLAVLKTGGIPSVLIELGFIETDWDVINDSAVMRRTCAALAAAILQA